MIKNPPPILVIACLFFIFGFVTWLNGALIPIFKITCELSDFESMLVAFSFYISYFVMALPASFLLNKAGFKKGMSLGLLIMAAGMLVFIPAAITRQYWVFLIGLFIIGSGLAVLQTAANPYVTIVGPPESAAQRISMMGIANKVAGVISPLLLSFLILADSEALLQQLAGATPQQKNDLLNLVTLKLVPPYLGMAVVLALLGVTIYRIQLPEVILSKNETADSPPEKSIFGFSHLWYGVIALFFAVGAEVIAGDTVISYAMYQQLPMSIAQTFTSITLACMTLGYLLGILLIPKYLSQEQMLSFASIVGLLLVLVAVFATGWLSVAAIACLGVANAILWPAIWPLSIKDLGIHTSTGASLLIMAIAGGAVLPLLYGYISDASNAQIAYIIMLPMYFFILFFAVKGHKAIVNRFN